MLKIIYYLKSEKENQYGECPIYAKINIGKKATTISTGKTIKQERWIETNRLRSLLRNNREKVIKEYLELFLLKAERFYNEEYKMGNIITLDELKSHLKGIEPVSEATYLIDLFNFHNSHFLKLVQINERSKASYQKYERSKELIQIFIKKKYGVNDIDVKEISSSFIYNLESFLKFESIYKGVVGIQNNSVVKYFKNFKTVCNYAMKMDLIERNPFKKYDGKLNVTEVTFLTEEELHRIESKTFAIERLEKVKDIFLFSCYTGYAPVDAQKLTQDNIVMDSNKELWIKTERQKTKTKANVPVLPQTLKIIQKYQYSEKGLIPKLSNQKMNAYLKEIADIIGLNKKLNWYSSRHTFATTVTLGNGIKIENVSAMLGHTTIKQTQHYAKILDSNVMDDMQKLKQKYLDKQ
ncbi:MAG: site-specific integrase [Flavobacterium sp.]|uniref:site-specific integrase n=1 Tax=Flavobacterium sp. TaxID=239 RepID=UPI003BCADF0C